MEDEKNAFYVVRKGDIIGIYKSFTDCQAQAGFSPLDPSISVYKGYCLSKEAESYLASNGLKKAGFSICASDVQDGLFGALSVCPFQDAVGSGSSSTSHSNYPVKLENYIEPQASLGPAHVAVPATNQRIRKHVGAGLNLLSATQDKHVELKNCTEPQNLFHPPRVSAESDPFLANAQKRPVESKNYVEPQQLVCASCQSCTIEFDGASKGNPGLAGAGVVLRAIDGSEVWQLREGVGIATNNVAEYRAVILGLKTALQKGFKHVRVRGDSLLVCNQIQGKWKTKNENMANLCKVARELKNNFLSFAIEHVAREFNSDADVQANRAISLIDGQIEMEVTRSWA